MGMTSVKLNLCDAAYPMMRLDRDVITLTKIDWIALYLLSLLFKL